MGGNVSVQTHVNKTVQTFKEKSSCSGNIDISQTISGIKIKPIGCPPPSFTFENDSKGVAVCDESSMIDQLAKDASKMTDKQKSSLSLSANLDASVFDNETSVKQAIKKKCHEKADAKQTISNIDYEPNCTGMSTEAMIATSKAAQTAFENRSSLTAMCVSRLVSTADQNTDSTQDDSQTNVGIGGNFVELIVLGVVAVALIHALLGRGGDKKKEQSEYDQPQPDSFSSNAVDSFFGMDSK